MDLTGLSRKHGLKLAPCFACSVKDCGLAVGGLVGHGSVKSAARMNHAVVIFVDSVEKAREVVASGVVVRGILVPVLPLAELAVRVTVLNVPPFVLDDALLGELVKHGRVVSQMRKVSSGCRSPLLRQYHRRQLHMVLTKTQALNLVIKERPVSLLCVDHKLLSKVFASRLREAMEQVIHRDQIYCVPGSLKSVAQEQKNEIMSQLQTIRYLMKKRGMDCPPVNEASCERNLEELIESLGASNASTAEAYLSGEQRVPGTEKGEQKRSETDDATTVGEEMSDLIPEESEGEAQVEVRAGEDNEEEKEEEVLVESELMPSLEEMYETNIQEVEAKQQASGLRRRNRLE